MLQNQINVANLSFVLHDHDQTAWVGCIKYNCLTPTDHLVSLIKTWHFQGYPQNILSQGVMEEIYNNNTTADDGNLWSLVELNRKYASTEQVLTEMWQKHWYSESGKFFAFRSDT